MVTNINDARASAPPGNPLTRDVDQWMTWWREQWLAFPTVSEDDDGRHFWSVTGDTGVYQDDWPLGERLAEETVAHMRRFPEGASVLRRILSRLDYSSTIAQGFVSRLEDILARPDLYPAVEADESGQQPES